MGVMTALLIPPLGLCQCLLLIINLEVAPKIFIINNVWDGLLPRGKCITDLPLLTYPKVCIVVDVTKVHGLERKKGSSHFLYVRQTQKNRVVRNVL